MKICNILQCHKNFNNRNSVCIEFEANNEKNIKVNGRFSAIEISYNRTRVWKMDSRILLWLNCNFRLNYVLKENIHVPMILNDIFIFIKFEDLIKQTDISQRRWSLPFIIQHPIANFLPFCWYFVNILTHDFHYSLN